MPAGMRSACVMREAPVSSARSPKQGGRIGPLFLVALVLCGCAAVGPDYRAPEPGVPATWQRSAAGSSVGMDSGTLDLSRWWANFDDPLLVDLVEQALTGSPDVKAALARLREARARRGAAAADRFPTLGVSASVRRSTSSGESGSGQTRDLYAAGFDAGWEADIFGGRRRALEAAQADLAAAAAELGDVRITLVAEVALNYVELRDYQARLAIARRNLASQEETFDLTRWRALAGLTTALDVEQARSGLEQTRAQIPGLLTGAVAAQNRLAVLLGRNPGELDGELAAVLPIPSPPMAIAVGIPADVLRRRPDIRAAERNLAAATARIGEAEADRYPDFSLSGSLGLESLALDSLFGGGAVTRSLAASLAANLFDGGRIRRNIEIRTALQEQALASYETTVLNALEEVENILAGLANRQAERDALRVATGSARSAAALAQAQYTSGLVDFQTVLDTQRSILNLESQLSSAESEIVSEVIRLYKALGGGWIGAAGASPDGRLE